MIALLAVLVLQAPSVDDLVRDLRADSVDVRGAASLELVRRGDAVVERLRRELAAAGEIELKSRIEDVLARIGREKRRSRFKGGEVLDGFCAALTVEQDKDTRESVFRVEIMNVDTKRRELAEIVAWNHRTPPGPEVAGLETRNLNAQALVSLRFDPPKKHPDGTLLKFSVAFGCHDPPVRKAAMLEPGESRVYSMKLKLAPDGYKAQVTYYGQSRKLLADATGDLTSNLVAFRVE